MAAGNVPGNDDIVELKPVSSVEYGGLAPPPAGTDDLTDTSIPVPRQAFVEYLADEKLRKNSCGTLPCTLLIWILFTTIVWLHGNVPSTYRVRTALYDSVNSIVVPYVPPDSLNVRKVDFNSIQDTAEVWAWISTGYVPAFGGRTPGQRPTIRTFNRVIGQAMLRQKRVLPASCKVDDDLAAYYGLDCYQSDSEVAVEPFGIMPYAAQDSAFIVGSGLKGDAVATAGNQFVAWLDLARPKSGGLAPGAQRALELFTAGWIDDATETVQLHTAVFNGEVAQFAHILVEFTFQRGGLVNKKIEVRPLNAIFFPSMIYMVLDILWALCMLTLLFNAFQTLADSKRSGPINRCCGDFWLFTDWVGSIVGLGLVLFFVVFAQKLGGTATRVGEIPHMAPMAPSELFDNATVVERSAVTETLRDYLSDVAVVIDDLEFLIWIKVRHRLGMFWYVTVIMVRFFRAFAGQPRVATIGRTIAQAGMDVVHLAIILFVVFGNFVLGGMMLFGAELKNWSTFTKGMRSTFNVVFGSGDFQEMYDVHPLSSIGWLLSFIVSVIFILRNLLIAILIDHHVDVQSKAGGHEGMNITHQSIDMVKDVWWNVSYMVRVVYRAIRPRCPKRCKSRLRKVKDEPWRKKIVYETLLANFGAQGYDDAENIDTDLQRRGKWEAVTVEQLVSSGSDKSTAQRMLMKCREHASQRTPDTYPPERLFAEFEGAMHRTYEQINGFENEVRGWLTEKIVDCSNMEPRQKKLDALALSLRPMETTPRSNEYDEDEDGLPPALDNAPGRLALQ